MTSTFQLDEALEKARRYSTSDPTSCALHSRRFAEGVVHSLYLQRHGNPGRETFQKQLDKLVIEGAIPEIIALSLNIVRLYGNYAAHPHSDVRLLDSSHVGPCMTALAHIDGWRSSSPSSAPQHTALLANGDSHLRLTVHFPDRVVVLPFNIIDSFGDLLDTVWAGISAHVLPFTYGERWHLRDRHSGRIIRGARQITGGRAGMPVADHRTLEETGIHPGAELVVHLSSPTA